MAIDAILPGDGSTSLSQAVSIARAYGQSAGTENNNRSAVIPVRLVLFSDGRICDLDKIVINSDELEFHNTGKITDNIAITAMQARRNYARPEEVEVFAALANYTRRQVACDVEFSVNGNVRAVRRVTIAAARMVKKEGDISDSGADSQGGKNAEGDKGKNRDKGSKEIDGAKGEKAQQGQGSVALIEPGRASITFSLSWPEGGVLEIRQLVPDGLSDDDAAWYVLNPPKRLAVLFVTAGNDVLESAIRACGLANVKVCTPAEFLKMDAAAMSIEQPWDVIVIDGAVPDKLSRGRYLIFGTAPKDINVKYAGQVKNQLMIDWRSQHPVLRYVDLTNFFAARAYKILLPREGQVLAELNETPAIVLLHHNDSVFLLAGFDIMDTNWPFDPGFVLFCYNAMSFLAEQAGNEDQANIKVNQPIVVNNIPAGTTVKISGPDGLEKSMQITDNKMLRFSGTHRVGLCKVQISGTPDRIWAVNLLDERESDIAPVSSLKFSGGEQVKAVRGALQRANVPVWPWLVGLCLMVAILEWLVYNKKVKL